MMTKKNSLALLQIIGSLAVLIGAVLKFFALDTAKYIFAGGAGIMVVVQMLYMAASKNEDQKIQRIYRLMFFSTLLLGAASYFMFTREYSWIPFVLAYAVVTLYLSYRSK